MKSPSGESSSLAALAATCRTTAAVPVTGAVQRNVQRAALLPPHPPAPPPAPRPPPPPPPGPPRPSRPSRCHRRPQECVLDVAHVGDAVGHDRGTSIYRGENARLSARE